MNTKYISRFAVTTTLALSAIMPLRAETPAPVPATISFGIGQAAGVQAAGLPADEMTVSKTAGLITVRAQVFNTVDLRTVSLFGNNRNSSIYMPPGSKSISLGLYWNVANSPAGDYTFHCTAIDKNNARTDKDVVVHVVP